MHHKRRRGKKQRAGCLLCKPHKMPGKGQRLSLPRDVRKTQDYE